MTTYKPGDPIEVSFGDGWEHGGRTYIGEWRDRIVYGYPGIPTPQEADPSQVRPYTPPVEIPDGWTLMRSDELDEDKHQVFDPADPEHPWGPDDSIIGGYTILVVARRRADR